MELRDYQIKAVDDVKKAYADGKKRVLLQLATGGGKTVIFSKIARLVADRGDKVLLSTNREELHAQGGDSFDRMGIRFSELTAKTKFPPGAQVVVAMTETLKRRLRRDDYLDFLSRFKMVIIDEAHLQAHNKLFESIGADQFVLGVSATPIRTGNMTPLDRDYDEMVKGPSISELIRRGHLSSVVTYSTPVDLSSVRMRGDDYDDADQSKVYDAPELYSGVIENWYRLTPNKRTIAFCSSVANSRKLCAQFQESGVVAAHIDADTPKEERKATFAAFKRGDITVLCNVGIATFGFDCPEIECVVLYLATTSIQKYLQMCGRGGRTSPGKEFFTVLDFGTNFHRLGSWDAEREWSLKKKRKSKKQQEAPVKMCPNCEAMLGMQVRVCPKCGYIYEKTEKEELFAMLEQMTPSEIQRYAESATIRELEDIREQRGYKAGWVLHKFKCAQDFLDYERLKGYKRGWALNQANKYLGLDLTWKEVYQ